MELIEITSVAQAKEIAKEGQGGRATKIDIEVELEAMKRGECGNCRIQASHNLNVSCSGTPMFKTMKVCDADHVYNPGWFNYCPLCGGDKDE